MSESLTARKRLLRRDVEARLADRGLKLHSKAEMGILFKGGPWASYASGYVISNGESEWDVANLWEAEDFLVSGPPFGVCERCNRWISAMTVSRNHARWPQRYLACSEHGRVGRWID